MITLTLWQKITLYILLLTGLFIYVKLSQLKINNVPLLKKEYKILIAVFFPLVLIGAILIGSLLLAVALVILSIIGVYSLVTKKRIHITLQKTIPKKPLN